MRKLGTPIIAPATGDFNRRFEISAVSTLPLTFYEPFVSVWIDDKEGAGNSDDGNLKFELWCLWLANINMEKGLSYGHLCGLLLKRVEDTRNDETYVRVGFWKLYLGYRS